MCEQGSAWVICPSKKFPGKFYYFNTQTGEKAWSWTDPTNKLHIKSGEDGSPTMINNNCIDNTQAGFKLMPNDPVSSRQSALLHTKSGEFCLPTTDNQFIDSTQEKFKPMQNNPFLWRQPRELHTYTREFSSPLSDNFISNTQATCKVMPNNSFSSRQPNQFYTESRKFGSPTTNSSNLSGNTQSKDKVLPNNTFLSRQRKRLYKETRKFGSPASSSNFSGNSQARFNLMQNNTFLLRQPIQLHTESRKFGSPAAPRYNPIPDNPFSSRLPKQLRTESNALGQARKKTKIDRQAASPIYDWDIDVDLMSNNNSSSATINQYCRNDSMKIIIDINFLRNLSKSELVKEWHIVPDVEVLLENLDFLKEFIAGDPTCTLMTPAAVLKKLQSLADSRATVAEQVFQWLAKHSVCEINNQDEYSLNDTAINDQIIKFCVEAKILHVVIITKKQCLRDAAKINGLHAYYLSELKITKESVQDENPKENLFLQDSDNLDPFLISKSTKTLTKSSPNEFTNYINENNNNTTINNLNWPTLKPLRQQNVCPNKQTRPYENVEIRVQNNEEMKIFYSQNLDKTDQNNTIHPVGRYLRNIHGNTNIKSVEENPLIFVKPISQKPINRFEGFKFNKPIDTNVFHNKSSETNENRNVVTSNSQKKINWFEGFNNAAINNNVFHKNSSETNENQDVVKANTRKQINICEDFKLNTPIDTNVFHNKSSERNKNHNDETPNAQKQINRFGGISFNAPIEMSLLSKNSSEINENQNGVNLSAQEPTNQFERINLNATNETVLFQNKPSQANENQIPIKIIAQTEANHFEVSIINADVNSNVCNAQADQISNIYEDYEMIEDQLKDFSTKHSNLQNYINDRVDEWSCCFVQIVEQFLDDVFQCTPGKKFDPPYWFQQGLKCLREYYSQNKYIGTVIDKLIGMCGYCIKNGVVRTNIKADQFLKILGAGVLLIERIDRIAQFPEISGYYTAMLYHLITTIQDPGDFPEILSLSLELSLRIGDEAFRMENAEMIRILDGHRLVPPSSLDQ